jgi:hypothetical protein
MGQFRSPVFNSSIRFLAAADGCSFGDASPGAWRPMILAQMGMLQAIHRHRERVFNPDRKDPHWENEERSASVSPAPTCKRLAVLPGFAQCV